MVFECEDYVDAITAERVLRVIEGYKHGGAQRTELLNGRLSWAKFKNRPGATVVGRVLRQPYTAKTGVTALDESYVPCFQRRDADLAKEVRKGFGLEGLQGSEGRIKANDEGPAHSSEMVDEDE